MTSAPLVSVPENECPEGGEAIFISNGPIQLRLARWRTPDGMPPRGTVILAHGRTEFIEKYYEVIKDLRRRGFAVLTFDWRGQGLSARELEDRQRGHIRRFEDFLEDLDCVFAGSFAQEMPVPRYVLAHSMGGNIMLRYLYGHPETAERAVFTAPMLGIGARAAQPAVRLISAGALLVGRGDDEPFGTKPTNPAESEFLGNPVTSDKARFDRTKASVIAEPRLGVGGLSWHWLKAATRSIDELWQPEFIKTLHTPILFVTAGDERLVDPIAAARYAALSPPCKLVTIKGALHEILMERNIYRDRFFELFDEFVSRN